MGKADVHLHTQFSDGVCSVEDVLEQSDRIGLKLIAITDHDTMDGAWQAKEYGKKYKVKVIPGMEISTFDGHLIALFIHKVIEKGLPLVDTLRLIKEQNGLALAPHIFSRSIDGISQRNLVDVVERFPEFKNVLVGVETIGSGNLVMGRYTEWAQELAKTLNLSGLGTSDAHTRDAIGSVLTAFRGHSINSFRNALIHRKTRAVIHHNYSLLKTVGDYLFYHGLKTIDQWV
jgi:predicted metal-dependent phosphoesterase TrpH